MMAISGNDGSKRVITWLHVSDFHFTDKDPYDRNVVLKALVTAVRTFYSEGRRPDLIFATGDIAYSGQADEYANASLFFDEILKETRLDKARLFVVPGNHDVDRNKGTGLARTLYSEAESVAFFSPVHEQLHSVKLDAFMNWYDEYFRDVRLWPRRSTCQTSVIKVRGMDVGVLQMNSALFCKDEHDNGMLWIGRRCLDEATAALEKESPDLRIAVLHHPLEWLHDQERSSIRTKLSLSADFVLRGHLHESEASEIVSPISGASSWSQRSYPGSTKRFSPAGSMLSLAAGACYQSRNFPNRALFVRVDTDGDKTHTFPIRYEDSPQEVWIVDTSLVRPPNFEGVFVFPTEKVAPREPEASGRVPSLQFSVMCLDFIEEERRPPTLRYLFYELPCPRLPFTVDRFYVVNCWANGEGQFQQSMKILTPDKTRILVETREQKFVLEDPNVPQLMINAFQDIKFNELGLYWVQTRLNGKLTLEYPLTVRVTEAVA